LNVEGVGKPAGFPLRLPAADRELLTMKSKLLYFSSGSQSEIVDVEQGETDDRGFEGAERREIPAPATTN